MLLPTDPHEDWLQMPFEQGGRRFGPLPDRVRIGSDPACDVVLGAALGVPPVAIELRRNERRAWTVEYASQPPWPCEIVRAHGPDEAAGPGRPVRSGGRFAPGETLALSAIGATPQFTLLRTGPFGPDPLADEEQPRDEVDVRITRRLAAAKVIVEDLDDPRAPDEVGASPRGAGGDLAGA
ncbi:MAG TPA: hypothetical protein PKA64_20060, partial [Myxococcota bacterium]|nr:hypothetical protein [Myxococcota bacterium]